MEEKKKGRPRKISESKATERYRSDSEDLEKLKEERLEKMKRFLRGGGVGTPDKSDSRCAFGKTDDGTSCSGDNNEYKVDLRIGALNKVDVGLSEQDAKEIKNAFGAGVLCRIHDCYLCHCLPFHRQAVSGDSFAVCSTDRMHRLFAGVYCGEKEEVSSFIVFPSTGCTNPGAISASGFITKSRSAINGWGRVYSAPEAEVTESTKSS